MARFKKIPLRENEGKITYGKKIINDVVLLAVSEIPYVELCGMVSISEMKASSIKIDFAKDGVYVEVAIKVHYTQSVSDVAFKIQESVRHNVEAMTDYKIAGVDVIVNGVLFDDKTVEKVVAVNETQQEG